MSRSSHPRVAALMRWVYGLFFLSGALGLVYEVLWLRKLLLVFGSTVHATSTVLTVFFGGLALGSWIFGRLIDRCPADGLRWYSRCELGIGLYAFLTVPLFGLIEHIYIPLYRASGFSPGVLVGSAFVCSTLVLLIPTTLMGGTFPLLSRFLIRAIQERGVQIASLYGINTIGAMLGTVFVYYVALQRLGWLITLQCAGLLNVLIAVVARVVNRHLSAAGLAALPTSASSDRSPRPIPRKVRWLLAAFALSGFAAMVYEVAWTRSLSLVLGSSIYAFCLMLATFLGGIAVGSFLARRWLRTHEADVWQFATWEGALAGYGLLSIGLFGRLPDLFVALWPLFGGSFAGLSVLQVGISLCIMAVPTLVLGFLFPVVSDILTGRFAQLGNRLGTAYAVNTAGGIAGSFLCGFWLIPTVGIAWTLVLAALVNLASALVIYVRFSDFPLARRIGFAAVSCLLYLGLGQWVFVPSWRQQVMVAGAYLDPKSYRAGTVGQAPDEKLLYYRESLNATVSVHQSGDNIYLKVGGKTDASLGVDMGTQVLSGQIPLLLHPNPSSVLVIGMGSGITLGSAGRHPVRRLDCAEIDPAVVEGARFFGAHNYHVHDDPRTHIYVADGRNVLLATPTQYDVIISEPSNPWMAGVASLFTHEFYELARRRLAPGGIMCQWIQLYRIFPEDVKLVLKTFHATFPYVSVWSTIPGDLILVGSLQPHQLHPDRLAAAFNEPAIRDDLRRVGVTHPQVLAELFWFGSDQVERLTEDQRWLHTDDLTWLEFDAPKALYLDRTLPINYQGLQQFKASSFLIAPGLADGRLEPEAQLALGTFYLFRKEPEQALAVLEPAAQGGSRRVELYLELAEAYAQKGAATSAMEALQQARRLDPRSFDAAIRLARVLMRENRLDEALAAYHDAASMKPLELDLAWEIGLAYRKAKQWQAAVPYLTASISAGPAHDQRSVALADTLYQLDRFEDARRLLEPLAGSQRVDALLLLGKISAETGQPDAAARWYAQALRAAPSSADTHFGLAELAQARQDWGMARRHLLDGLRQDPYNVKALEQLRTADAYLTQR